MTEERLEQYRALKLEILQLESQLKELQNKGPQDITDSVTTAANFPYSKHTLVIGGLDIGGYIKREERMQKKHRELLNKAKSEVKEIEDFIFNAPTPQLRVILRFRYIDNLSWLRIAVKMGWHDECVPRQKIKKFLADTENTEKSVV